MAATFVPYDGTGATAAAGDDVISAPPPPPPPPPAPPSSSSPKKTTTSNTTTNADAWEAQSQLTDDFDLACYDDITSSDSYYSTDDDDDDTEAADTSATVLGDLDDLKRTFAEALQFIGVGTTATASPPPVREERPSESSPKKTKRRGSSSSRRRGRGRRKGEMSDRHGGSGRRRRKHDGTTTSRGKNRRKSKSKKSKNPNNKSSKARGPVAESPTRHSTPSRPRRRTPSASIMKKSSRDGATAAAASGRALPPPPPPPQVPTLAEWSEAYGTDRELQVVKILVQNGAAREAYVWQLQQNQTQKQTQKQEDQQEEDKGQERDKGQEDQKDNKGQEDSSSFRLSLHEELLAHQLRYDARDAMLYYVEDGPQSSSDARSATNTASTNPTPSLLANRTNSLRIVPQSLRRRLFHVALHQAGPSAASLTAAGTGMDTATSSISTGTAFSVFHRLRSSYYWAGMYHDVHRWWADRERMQLSNARALGVVTTGDGQPTNTTTTPPRRPFDEYNMTGGGDESPYRVTFSLEDGWEDAASATNKDADDVNTTLDTCLDVTMDTDDGSGNGHGLLFGTPPPSPKKNTKPDPPGSAASASKTKTTKKKTSPMNGLRRAMRSLSPSPNRKGLATVEYSQGSRAAPSDGSATSAPLAVARSRTGTPTNLSDAPTLVRRTSFISLLRSKSTDVDDDSYVSNKAAPSTGLPPRPSSPRATLAPSSAQSTPSRRPSTHADAGLLPPISPASTTSSSPRQLKKSDSVESFSQRFKGIGKKIAAGRKDPNVCTVTPVVRVPSSENAAVDSVERPRGSSRSPSPAPRRAAATDAKPRASVAGTGQQQDQQKKEEEQSAETSGKDVPASFSMANSMESASNQLVAFLDALADSLCHDGNSDDEAEALQVWQRAVPTVIGTNNPKQK